MEIDNWEIKRGKLYRKFIFNDFEDAFSFMTKVAQLAEKHNHHPDWKNSYNKVEIQLFTYDLNSISHKDYKLAQEIDMIYESN